MKLRRAFIRGISWLPSAGLRRLGYRQLRGYSIDPTARIGWRTVVDVETLELAAESSLGPKSSLRGPMRVSIGPRASVGASNTIECGAWYAQFDSAEAPYAREFVVGRDCLITSGHFFDAVGGIYLGDGTCIAGSGSQFWTHGVGVEDRSIFVGRYCYIGSAARFAPGARVADLVVVGLGSVVVGDMTEYRESLLAGVPAVLVRKDYRVPGWDVLEKAIAEGRIEYRSVEDRERVG